MGGLPVASNRQDQPLPAFEKPAVTLQKAKPQAPVTLKPSVLPAGKKQNAAGTSHKPHLAAKPTQRVDVPGAVHIHNDLRNDFYLNLEPGLLGRNQRRRSPMHDVTEPPKLNARRGDGPTQVRSVVAQDLPAGHRTVAVAPPLPGKRRRKDEPPKLPSPQKPKPSPNAEQPGFVKFRLVSQRVALAGGKGGFA